MDKTRFLRLGEQIRDEISALILSGKIKDPRVSSFLSINRVEVSGDLAYAKVYVSSFMNDHQTKQGLSGLEHAAGFIRSTISKKLHVFQFPKLTFIFDTSIQDGFDIVKKLDAMDISPDDGLESGL